MKNSGAAFMKDIIKDIYDENGLKRKHSHSGVKQTKQATSFVQVVNTAFRRLSQSRF